MPTPRLVAACALLAGAAHAQQLVLKAGTPITIANPAEFIPSQAHLGDTLDFVTSFPVRVGKTAVIPKNTVLHGRISALKPKLEITLDPIAVNGATVAFSGRPFEAKGAKRDDTSETPPEFAWHYQFTTREKFQIAGLVLVAAPIVIVAAVVVGAVVLPIYAVYAITHPHHFGNKHAFTRSLVTVSADTTFETSALPGPKPYTGLPLLYLVDHYRTDNAQLLCNGQPFFARAYGKQVALRVPAQTYTFSASEANQTSATIDAKPDGRYVIFRDKAGLHSEDLAIHPELLEQGILPDESKSAGFFFDYTRIPPPSRPISTGSVSAAAAASPRCCTSGPHARTSPKPPPPPRSPALCRWHLHPAATATRTPRRARHIAPSIAFTAPSTTVSPAHSSSTRSRNRACTRPIFSTTLPV